MNKSKAKVMMENDTPVYISTTQIENVENYIYMGHDTITERNQDKKIHRRITADWTELIHQLQRVTFETA